MTAVLHQNPPEAYRAELAQNDQGSDSEAAQAARGYRDILPRPTIEPRRTADSLRGLAVGKMIGTADIPGKQPASFLPEGRCIVGDPEGLDGGLDENGRPHYTAVDVSMLGVLRQFPGTWRTRNELTRFIDDRSVGATIVLGKRFIGKLACDQLYAGRLYHVAPQDLPAGPESGFSKTGYYTLKLLPGEERLPADPLLDSITPPPEGWEADAACSSQFTEAFYADPSIANSMRAAKLICSGCAVLDQCLEKSLFYETAAYHREGIYGGLSAEERQRVVDEKAKYGPEAAAKLIATLRQQGFEDARSAYHSSRGIHNKWEQSAEKVRAQAQVRAEKRAMNALSLARPQNSIAASA